MALGVEVASLDCPWRRCTWFFFGNFATFAFFGGVDEPVFHTIDSRFVSGSLKFTHVSSVVIIWIRNRIPSLRQRRKITVDNRTRTPFSSAESKRGTNRALTLLIFVSSFRNLSTVPWLTPILSATASMDWGRFDEIGSRTFWKVFGFEDGLPESLWSSVFSMRPSRNLRCHSNTRVLEQLEPSFGLFTKFPGVRRSHSWLYTELNYCSMLRTFSWRRHFCASFFSDAVASILNYAIVVWRMTSKLRDSIVQISVRHHVTFWKRATA